MLRLPLIHKKQSKEKFPGVILYQSIQHRPDGLWFNYSKMSKDLQAPTNLFNELEVLHVKNWLVQIRVATVFTLSPSPVTEILFFIMKL
jgi:hypothetical protein